MDGIKIYSRRRDYWTDSLKEHWIIWTSISTFIALASFAKLDPSDDVRGWLFYLLLFIFFGYFTLSSVAFHAAVKAVKSFVDKNEYSPCFEGISHVSLISGTNNYRVIAKPPRGIRVPVNTLVCVYERSEYQQIIGLGKAIKENEDNSIELTVTSSETTSAIWESMLSAESFEKTIISVLVPKEVIPDIDVYLNSENVAIKQLTNLDLQSDGGDIEL